MINEIDDSKQDQANYKTPETLAAEQQERRERWETIRSEIEKITDGLGKGIDQGIKESVIAFAAFNIPTFQSCEGHEEGEHGLPYPWLIAQQPELDSEDGAKVDEQEFIKSSLIEHAKVMSLLSEFYKSRVSPVDARLIIDYLGSAGKGTVKSLGGEELRVTDRSTREFKDKFALYQKEMADFAEFLKDKYIREGANALREQAEQNQNESLIQEKITPEDIKRFSTELIEGIKDISDQPTIEEIGNVYDGILSGKESWSIKMRGNRLKAFQEIISQSMEKYLPVTARKELAPLHVELAGYDNSPYEKISSFKALAETLYKYKQVFEKYGVTEEQIAKFLIEQIKNSK